MSCEFKLNFNSLGFVISKLTELIRDPTKEYRVTIKQWREKRSLSQNSLYWKWLDEINKQAPLKISNGNVKGSELWHEVFKRYYCPEKQITNGKVSVISKSTKMLDVGEMTHYLNRIENWCIDRGIKITIPDDSEYSQLMRKQIE